jgi:PAS domain S-box-containing protein
MNDSDKTKEQLIQEVELLRALIDALPDRLYVKDAKSRFVICNKAVEKDSDVNLPENLTGKSDFDLFPSELANALYAVEQEIIKTGKPMVNEEAHRTRRKDGQENWSLCTKMPWRDKNGNIIGIIGANRDITEQKKVELALRESEARYKAIFESAREGIVVGIIETRQFVYANPAICKMFGYTAEELTRMAVKDIHPREHLQYVSGRFEALMRNEVAFTQNIPCLRKNGTVFYADISATRIVINNKACFVGFFTDTTERKRTEDALRESEARYKAIFESAKEGIVVVNIETKQFKYANPAACKIFGYTAEEFTHLTINDVHPKKDLPQMLAEFAMHARDEKVLSRNIPCIRKDGTTFYGDISSTNVEIDKTSCNVGLITDTTERKQTEDALRESEARYKAIFNYATEGILIVDTETKRLNYANQAACEMFGYTAEQFQRITVYDMHPKEYISSVLARFKALSQGKKTLAHDVPCIRKDGTLFYADINSTSIIIDQKPCNMGLFTNITERKKVEGRLQKAHEELETRVKKRTAELAKAVETLQKEIAERKHAEKSLRDAEVRFRSIFENTIVGLYRTTPSGRILLANPALVKMMGCRSFKQLTNFNVEKNGFDPSTPRSRFKKLIKKEGRVIGLESVWRRLDGTKLFVSENAFAVKDAKGKILYYEGTAQDVTKRKEAEAKLMLYQQQLRSLASELSLAEERLRRRIAAELHDHIAQNLAISKIKLESLKDDVEPGPAKSLKDVIDLISQTIDASRSLTFEISPPVLYELGFEAAVGWLVKQTRQRFGLDVEFINDEKPKPLNADIRVLLFQAVRELLVNVIKHAKAKKAKVYALAVDDNIQVTVEDDGIGIDTADLNSTKDFTKGGFGLFNIRERLDQIGGSVIIQSGRKKGTQITMTAPIEKQKKPRTRFSGARSEKNGRQRKNKK